MDKRKLLNLSSNSYSRFLSSCYRKESFLDIDFFRKSVALHYQHIYLSKKRLSKAYRLAFFSLSAIFCLLAICIYFKTANYTCGLYFGECGFIKDCVDGSCLLFSALTFGLGYWTHPDKEALRFLVRKVEKEFKNHPLKTDLTHIFNNLINQPIAL